MEYAVGLVCLGQVYVTSYSPVLSLQQRRLLGGLLSQATVVLSKLALGGCKQHSQA